MLATEFQHKTQNTEQQEEEKYLMRLLDKRWSPRSYSGKPISNEKIQKLFDAGRQAMSSFNEQPWRVIFASKEDDHYDKLFECLSDFNQQWVKTASCLGVVLGKKHFTKLKKENRHRFYDSGAFMAYVALRATSLGLFVHQMAGFSPDNVIENFEIPGEFEPITMFVIGQPDDPEKLPEKLQEQESPNSERKGVNEILFGAEWGHSYV
ncbi:MAG TPA: nitroreductase family protein [Sunxiuqinia sp.]|nr:nitroreductase family protein [Sunxiuqinia sp.]